MSFNQVALLIPVAEKFIDAGRKLAKHKTRGISELATDAVNPTTTHDAVECLFSCTKPGCTGNVNYIFERTLDGKTARAGTYQWKRVRY